MATESITAKRIAWIVPNWLQGLLALALTAGALTLLAFGWRYTGSPLTVEADGQRHDLRTHAPTVGEALRRAGFDLYPEDQVVPGREAALQPGMVVQVRRAQPVVLSADGRARQLRTHATTVGQLLAEAGVQLGPADELWLGDRLAGEDTPLCGADCQSALQSRLVSHRGGLRAIPAAPAGDPPLVRVQRAISLTLDDNGVTRVLHTTLTTVGQVLQEQGVTLFLGDEVVPGLQERVASGMTVLIHRSIPVAIEVDGRTIHTRTRAKTVAGLLGQEGIALMGKDRVEPGLDAAIWANLVVRITRVREELIVEFEPIPFETVWIPDPEVEIDNTRLVQPGQIGLSKRRFRVVYEDGQEVERFLEDVWTEQPPITKTLAYGTKIVIRTLDTPDGPIEYWRKIRVYTTSYTAASCGKSKDHPRYGYTRLGWKLTKGIVAVDPTVIPLRTWLYIPGYGLARAGDTGGGVKGKFVDLGFDTWNYQSWHWWTDVYLLTPVPPHSQIRWVLPNWPKFPDRRR